MGWMRGGNGLAWSGLAGQRVCSIEVPLIPQRRGAAGSDREVDGESIGHDQAGGLGKDERRDEDAEGGWKTGDGAGAVADLCRVIPFIGRLNLRENESGVGLIPQGIRALEEPLHGQWTRAGGGDGEGGGGAIRGDSALRLRRDGRRDEHGE